MREIIAEERLQRKDIKIQEEQKKRDEEVQQRMTVEEAKKAQEENEIRLKEQAKFKDSILNNEEK